MNKILTGLVLSATGVLASSSIALAGFKTAPLGIKGLPGTEMGLMAMAALGVIGGIMIARRKR